jgi:hypothetical protein
MGFPDPKTKIGEKSKRPHAGIPLNKDVIKKLIIESHGNLSHIADAIGSSRGVVRRFCDRDDELKECLSDARERIIDKLEKSCWDDAINRRDTGLRCFLLKTQARHRGYDQDEGKNMAKDIASAAFEYIIKKDSDKANTSH